MGVPLTKKGFEKLQEELRKLKNDERPAVIAAIASARELGDLSENAEYHAAKEKQVVIESRIEVLDKLLSQALVVDPARVHSDKVAFGATVEIEEEESEQTSRFQIVGSEEADIKAGLLPITSPLARTLIGKRVGDTVDVRTPSGLKGYTILKLEYI